MMWKKYLQGIVITLIVGLGIKTSVENFSSSLHDTSNNTKVIADWNKQISKIITRIPIKHGLVGYISNEDVLGKTVSTNDAEGEYVLTQYSIAPLVLVRGTNQEWNILNLEPENYKKWMRENEKAFELVKVSGGMYLVHRMNK
jgi:hypothetical protein